MAGFPLVGGGVSPTTRKIGLSHHVSLMFCLQNVDFVLFMQSLSILPKFPPPSPQVDPIWVTLYVYPTQEVVEVMTFSLVPLPST